MKEKQRPKCDLTGRTYVHGKVEQTGRKRAAQIGFFRKQAGNAFPTSIDVYF